MSVTEPLIPGAPAAGPPPAATQRGVGARLSARAEALATPTNAVRLAMAASLVALAVFLVRATYPNYDSYYALIWGKQLASGHLPDYDVLRTPTPHPLAMGVAAFLSLFGGAADRLFVLLTIGCFLGLLAVLFRFTQLLLGTLVALIAVAVVLTRTDLEFFALRGVTDVPFLLLIFGAALLELKRPRCGVPVLVLLGLAGLLRPEAWVFSGLYLLWLWPAVGIRPWLGYAALAAAAPVLWAGLDWIIAGDPLHSLTSTREVAGQFGRQRSVGSAIRLIPTYIGENEKLLYDGAGGLGALFALVLLRRRAALPLALMAIGVGTFLAIAAAGLSVIPRYLLVPSLLFDAGVAAALVGWTLVTDPRGRRVAAALAVLSLAALVWRAPSLVSDVRRLNGQTLFVEHQHRDLKAILQQPDVAPLLRTCWPITVPTHSAIPVIEYETGLPKRSLQATIAQRRPPAHGLLLIGKTFNFEPAAARSVTGIGTSSARKWWSNYPLSTFRQIARNGFWQVYARCGSA